jgi:hypothetical protein
MHPVANRSLFRLKNPQRILKIEPNRRRNLLASHIASLRIKQKALAKNSNQAKIFSNQLVGQLL